MKEIGGYFELEQLIDRPYHNNAICLNTASNALIYLIKTRKIKKVFIPSFLCDSISNALKKHSVEYGIYHITEDFFPDFNQKLGKDEYLYIVNFYGQIKNDHIKTLKEKYFKIILDNTQAFFQKPIMGIDTIYSCRKFFGVPDGSYLAAEIILKEKFETGISKDKMKHILGRFEGNASDYYSDFKKNEDYLGNEPIKLMSKLTKNLMGSVDYQKVIAKRNENFNYLHEKLRDQNQLELSVPTGPFAYPFYSENASGIRKELVEKKIYLPVLWPNVLENQEASKLERRYAEYILPIPCDQRYDSEEMQMLIKELKKCID